MQTSFTLFLEAGYRQREKGRLLPRAHATLIAATIFEAGYQVCLRSPGYIYTTSSRWQS